MKWINCMDKRFPGLYLHEIAFSLVPQQLFCTKQKISASQGKET